MMKKAITVMTGLLCATTFITISCSKSSEDELNSQNPPTTTCDTANSAYAADVVPILKANCYSCHGNGGASGGVNLDTYVNVKEAADNGSLLGTIMHASGYPAMPLSGGQLSECDINIINSWIKNGMQNN